MWVRYTHASTGGEPGQCERSPLRLQVRRAVSPTLAHHLAMTDSPAPTAPIGFARLASDVPIDRFAEDLVHDTGVLLMPGSVFGRTNLPGALERLEVYAERTLR